MQGFSSQNRSRQFVSIDFSEELLPKTTRILLTSTSFKYLLSAQRLHDLSDAEISTSSLSKRRIHSVFFLEQIQLSPYAFWDQTGTTVAGWTNGTPGSSRSQLNHPVDLSITTNDVLYVSDKLNNRIIVVYLNDYNNIFVIGPILDSSTSPFNQTTGLFATKTALYVLDSDNHRVQQLSLNGTNAATVFNFSTSDWPHYLYVDEDTNIYVSITFSHKVLLCHLNAVNCTIVAGTGVAGSDNNTLNRSYGVFVTDDKTIYVADYCNHRIMKWLLNASTGIRVAGDGTPGSQLTQLNRPTAVVVDRNGYMYISEDGNHRIVRWVPN